MQRLKYSAIVVTDETNTKQAYCAVIEHRALTGCVLALLSQVNQPIHYRGPQLQTAVGMYLYSIYSVTDSLRCC